MEKTKLIPPLKGENLYRILIDYTELGEHRTASKVDLRTTQWLVDHLKLVGFKVECQPFSLNYFDLRKYEALIDNKKIDIFPLWPPKVTGSTPIQGPLVKIPLKTNRQFLGDTIGLIKFPFDTAASVFPGSSYLKIIEPALKTGVKALIAITEGVTGEIIALNCIGIQDPWPLPIFLAAGKDSSILENATEKQLQASLLLEGEFKSETQAYNVIGKIGEGKKTIIISTSHSGWFGCAGERGPGLALFLGLAQWASTRKSKVNYLFLSTSGHEFGGLGMQAFMKELTPNKNDIICWLHLGAGIATWKWKKTTQGLKKLDVPEKRRYLMASDNIMNAIKEAFSHVKRINIISGRVIGELRIIKQLGYPTYFGIAAGHIYHHTPADLPHVTGPQILEEIALGLVRALVSI